MTQSKIEWTDATCEAVSGCELESPGCTNCYAMRLCGGRLKHNPHWAGLTKPGPKGPVWTGEIRLNRDLMLQPLTWRKPRRIFWCSRSDLAHPDVPFEYLDECFAVMALTPQHIHQVLTKRPGRLREYLADPKTRDRIEAIVFDWLSTHRSREAAEDWYQGGATLWPLPNVHLGTSIEDQTRADERLPELKATPAAVRFVSAEPLLGPIDCKLWEAEGDLMRGEAEPLIHQVIVGGESGPHGRPPHIMWVRSLRDQCESNGVAFYFKQWGTWVPLGQMPFRERLELRRRRLAGRPPPINCWVKHDGTWGTDPHKMPRNDGHCHALVMVKLGKAKTGALLDGETYQQCPGELTER